MPDDNDVMQQGLACFIPLIENAPDDDYLRLIVDCIESMNDQVHFGNGQTWKLLSSAVVKRKGYRRDRFNVDFAVEAYQSTYDPDHDLFQKPMRDRLEYVVKQALK